jgi:signal transduction histidine kinase
VTRPFGPRFRQRVVAATLLAVALLAVAAGLFIIDATGGGVIARRQHLVAESARDYFVAFAHEEGLAPLARAIDRRERIGADEAFRYAIFANDGRLLGGADLLRNSQLPKPGASQVVIPTDQGDTRWEVLVQPISTGGTLVIYEDLSERGDFRRALAMGSIAAVVTAAAAVVIASLWLSRLVYRRADDIAGTTEAIVSGQLSARAPVAPNGDVFDRLSASINTMLDKNEELTTGLRTVTDSLAHDLRTPLTRLKGALTRALDDDLDAAARRELLGSAWDEADRALGTTSALLDIARAESGLSRDMFQAVDLGALIAGLAELFGPALEDAGQSLAVDAPGRPLTIQAHELLLRQAVGDLLFNASRYAGPGARVRIAAQATPEGARIVVADTGPGVPAAERGRVVERFVRLDAARTSPGSGLGLAIAAACAKLHQGRLTLEDNDPGLRVVMDLSR